VFSAGLFRIASLASALAFAAFALASGEARHTQSSQSSKNRLSRKTQTMSDSKGLNWLGSKSSDYRSRMWLDSTD
jgi:hypothetical protein